MDTEMPLEIRIRRLEKEDIRETSCIDIYISVI